MVFVSPEASLAHAERRALLTTGAAVLAEPHLARSQTAKTLKFVPQIDVPLLDSVVTSAYISRNHGFVVFDTLFGQDSAFKAQPQMVDGFTTEPDDKTIVFRLKRPAGPAGTVGYWLAHVAVRGRFRFVQLAEQQDHHRCGTGLTDRRRQRDAGHQQAARPDYQCGAGGGDPRAVRDQRDHRLALHRGDIFSSGVPRTGRGMSF